MSLRAYIDTQKAKITSITLTTGEYVSRSFYALIELNDTTKVEFDAFIDQARGVYIKSYDFAEGEDFTKGFIPQIQSIASVFTFASKLGEGVMRELGWYKEDGAEAFIELSKYNNNNLKVTIEGKTLASINRLWNLIKEGNILPYKLQVKTSKKPVIFAEEVLETVNGLRKKLDWALDELARADRVIQHSNEMTAEWERISRKREELISSLQSEIIFCG